MVKNLWLDPFDPKAEYVARKAFGGYTMGDEIDKSKLPHTRRLRQLYDNRMIVTRDMWERHVNGVEDEPREFKKSTLKFDAPEKVVTDAVNKINKDVEDGIKEGLETLPENVKATAETVTFLNSESPLPAPMPAAVPAPDSGGQPSKETLTKDAEELGIKVDGRWSVERIQSEIDKALSDGESA